jgi:hypothetical protein
MIRLGLGTSISSVTSLLNVPYPTSVWILASNAWNDVGTAWYDTSVWQD